MAEKFRKIEFYRDYFREFVGGQTQEVRDKIYWTLTVIEEMPRVSRNYLKKLEGADGLFEIRVQFGGDIFRIFVFSTMAD